MCQVFLNLLVQRQSETSKLIESLKERIDRIEELKAFTSKLETIVENQHKVAEIAEKHADSQSQGLSKVEYSLMTKELQSVSNILQNRVVSSNEVNSRKIDEISRLIAELKSKLDMNAIQQQNIQTNLVNNAENLHQKIEKESSWGFYIYMLLFQILFGISFMWFKKYRDEKSKLI